MPVKAQLFENLSYTSLARLMSKSLRLQNSVEPAPSMILKNFCSITHEHLAKHLTCNIWVFVFQFQISNCNTIGRTNSGNSDTSSAKGLQLRIASSIAMLRMQYQS